MNAGEAERMNTYLGAISALSPLGKPGHWVKFSTRIAIANACMGIADAENAALSAEVGRFTTPTVVTALDAIDPTGDPEHAHILADKILLCALGPDVEAAYDRLVARCSWW